MPSWNIYLRLIPFPRPRGGVLFPGNREVFYILNSLIVLCVCVSVYVVFVSFKVYMNTITLCPELGGADLFIC